MHLSIFNFKRFIFKSLLIAFVFTLVYIVVIQFFKPKITFIQNQGQANVVFAQDFIYTKNKPENIIVGSSMATRMKFLENKEVYNLAFGGGGPLTGLKIIRESGFVPKSIFIESNVFTMLTDEDLVETLFPPVLNPLRGNILAFQEKYQFLNLIGSVIYSIVGRSQEEKLNQKVDKRLVDKLVNEAQKKDHNFTLENRDKLLSQWHKEIIYFKNTGTKIVFFEMPNDSRLVISNERVAVRRLIQSEFSEIPFVLEENKDDKYQTTDGIHLTIESAMGFSYNFDTKILSKRW